MFEHRLPEQLFLLLHSSKVTYIPTCDGRYQPLARFNKTEVGMRLLCAAETVKKIEGRELLAPWISKVLSHSQVPKHTAYLSHRSNTLILLVKDNIRHSGCCYKGNGQGRAP